MELVTTLLVIFVFEMAALRWSFESGDDWSSPEWERRRNWRGFSVISLGVFLAASGPWRAAWLRPPTQQPESRR